MKKVREFVLPLLLLFGFFLSWHFAVKIFSISKFTLPAPASVLESFMTNELEVY